MVMAAERPTRAACDRQASAAGGGGAMARALADRYARYISAYWRGDPDASAMGRRLSAFWQARLPLAPPRSPDAVSPHGGGGRGICWYETADAVVCYVPGVRGGYLLPKTALPLAPPKIGRAYLRAIATSGVWER
ncbi:MAG TPA: hypothetical protein VFQ80_11390 [Thermomicrobiales bacterium]|jgi:hypothetical protein|nr:hypothetical protein [Thermomicrobiales bacterium]